MQTKTIMRYHWRHTRTAKIKRQKQVLVRVWRDEIPHTLRQEYKTTHLFQKTVCSSGCQTDLSQDPAALLVNMSPRGVRTEVRRKVCTRMFTSTLSIRASKWKQPSVHQLLKAYRKYGIPSNEIFGVRSTDVSYHLGGPWKILCRVRESSQKKDCMFYDSTCTEFPEEKNV